MNSTAKYLFAAAALGTAAAASACTSWMVHPSASASGRMIVHKCRDNRVTPLDAGIHHTRNGVKWMRFGACKEALFSVSERGIASVMNDGDPMTTKHPNDAIKDLNKARFGMWCGVTTKQIMDECTTAAQAAKIAEYYAKNFIKTGHGNSMFVADAKRAFFIDFGPGYAGVKELTGGICIITNCMHMPGCESLSLRTAGALCSDRAREANVRVSLKKHREKGKYTVLGTMKTSRMRCQGKYAQKFPCRKNSLSGVCFEIDPEFPKYLTTSYAALGPQQHTLYLIIPMSLEQMPEFFRNGGWSDMAYKLRERVGFDHKYLPRFEEFEKRHMAEYDQLREEARALLRENKTAEAVKLLNGFFERQYEAGLALLKEVNADAMANPPPSPKLEATY